MGPRKEGIAWGEQKMLVIPRTWCVANIVRRLANNRGTGMIGTAL